MSHERDTGSTRPERTDRRTLKGSSLLHLLSALIFLVSSGMGPRPYGGQMSPQGDGSRNVWFSSWREPQGHEGADGLVSDETVGIHGGILFLETVSVVDKPVVPYIIAGI